MSFAVVHVQKFKSSSVKGIQVHNQREKESKTNPDIDKEKSRLNYDLHNQQPVNYNQRVKEIISENVITHKAIRKDAVVMCNILVTSDHDFFKNMSAADTKKFFEKSYEFFKDRYGEQKIVAAPVHLDEKTPHMHVSVVPATEDNRLSAKTMFDRNELRSLQDDYPKFMQEQGFDVQRGIDALTQENRELTKAVNHYSKKDMDRKHQQLQDKNDFIKIGDKLDKALDFLEKIDKMDEFKDFEKEKKQMEIVKKIDMEM